MDVPQPVWGFHFCIYSDFWFLTSQASEPRRHSLESDRAEGDDPISWTQQACGHLGKSCRALWGVVLLLPFLWDCSTAMSVPGMERPSLLASCRLGSAIYRETGDPPGQLSHVGFEWRQLMLLPLINGDFHLSYLLLGHTREGLPPGYTWAVELWNLE